VSADPVRAIADAVLYEGYILWPYRRSALKNQRRFTFGGVYPPAHSAAHPDDRSRTQTQALIRGKPSTEVSITVRFLQVVVRQLMRRGGDALEPVDQLVVDGQRHVAWEEAAEREFSVTGSLGQLRSERLLPIAIEAGRDCEQIGDSGVFVRGWQELRAELRVSAEALGGGLWRLTAATKNTTATEGQSRQQALAQTLCSTHVLMRAPQGEFVSLTDPPPELAAEAAACTNIGTWPVLVGDAGAPTTLLSSPIILEDYPRVAPESPGDLFDGGEIDQLLILNVLALSDEEKAEMAASDPRAREILKRTEALTAEQLMALHGTIREFGMAR
jgi:hydrogenase maturation protease